MFFAFLAQFAAGCFIAVAVSDIKRCGWRYLRLMAIVSLAVAFFATMLVLREGNLEPEVFTSLPALALFASILFGIAWLFINAKQQDHVTNAQRIAAGLAGIAGAIAAILLTRRSDELIAQTGADAFSALFAINALIGAGVLGTVSAGMLLGHRYLTDTNMPIAPLRRLTIIYLAVFGVRVVWSIVNALPVWTSNFRPHESPLFFQLALYVRLGVGLAVAAVFAYMIWDCVRRRATQSATAMLYLSMVLVFIGELAGQFLMRTEGLAV